MRGEAGGAGNLLPPVVSKDGTSIAVWKEGSGPPLLLVHGTMADHSTTWQYVLPQLTRRFTVYRMDRRGRGASGDSPDYALEREAEDIAAVVDSIGEPVGVVGHSFGGLCALEASLLAENVGRLVVYEGAVVRGADLMPAGAVDRLETMLRQGDVEGMLIAMLSDLVGASAEDIEMLRSQKESWAVRLSNAPTIPREVRAMAAYSFSPSRFTRFVVPTLFLVGERSPERDLSDASALVKGLPRAHVRILEGQGHLATYTAPDLFVRELVGFFQSPT